MHAPHTGHDSILRDKRAVRYFLFGAFLVANAVVAELIGVKLFQLEDALGIEKANISLLGYDGLNFKLSTGVLSWPLVFLVTDLVNDYFGVRGVRFLTLVTAALIALVFPVLWIAIEMPPDRDWWMASSAEAGVPNMQAAFTAVFGQGMNIIIGSLAAFLVSQLVDSLCVVWIAFALFRGMPMAQATALALTSYAYKFLVAVLSTPLLYLGHAIVERWLGKELAQRMREDALRSGADA